MAEIESFGRYQLLRLAGTGGMAQVHIARQVGPEGFVKPCVLKRIAPQAADSDEVRRMFLEEARITALLNHPNVVQTFDFGQVDGVPYLAMELVDGVNLAQLCRTLAKAERWIPLRPGLELAVGLLEGLEYAHQLTDLDGRRLNLVHRDVSPQNTLLSRQGGVKLADFGIARHDAREMVTQGDTAKGKPGYMAPEQAMGQKVDGRADLFSVGIILTELISARRVLAGQERVAGILGIRARVQELCALRKDAPPALVELVLQLTALEPDRRPASAREAADALRGVLAGMPAGASLDAFLRSVFATYIASDPEVQILGSPSPAPSPLAAPVSLTPPPAAEAPELAFDEKTWVQKEAARGTSGVYEGWPKAYLPTAVPSLELVSRSSSVDAMQFFGAETSPEAEKRGQVVPPPATTTNPKARLPYVPGPKAAMLGFNQVIQGAAEDLAAEDTKLEEKTGTPSPKKRRELPPVLMLVGGAVAVIGLGVGVVAAVSKLAGGGEPPKPALGSIVVASAPEGATIWVDGQKTRFTTPYTLSDLPVDRPFKIAVQKRGYLSVPKEAVVRIPPGTTNTSAAFKLKQGRVFRIVTEPDGAMVSMNDHRLPEVTPLTLDAVPFGQSATLSVSLDGFLPTKIVLESRASTATVTELKLEPGREIDISSDPPGAEVWIEDQMRGRTPLYDVLVPVERRFTVRVKKRGFKAWRQRLVGKRLGEEPLVAELAALPFLAMPMSKEELRTAKDLDRSVARLKREAMGLSTKLGAAQRELERVEASDTVFVGKIADAQRRVDLIRDRIDAVDLELQDAEGKMEAFRDQVLLKMEMEAEAD